MRTLPALLSVAALAGCTEEPPLIAGTWVGVLPERFGSVTFHADGSYVSSRDEFALSGTYTFHGDRLHLEPTGAPDPIEMSVGIRGADMFAAAYVLVDTSPDGSVSTYQSSVLRGGVALIDTFELATDGTAVRTFVDEMPEPRVFHGTWEYHFQWMLFHEESGMETMLPRSPYYFGTELYTRAPDG